MLHFECAAHRVDDAAELDDAAVAGALDDAAMMHGDCGINQVASQRPQQRQNPVFVGSGKPANSSTTSDTKIAAILRASRPRRYAAATRSAVSGRPGKASGGHRKDARGMSIIGVSMARFHAALRKTWKQGAQPLRFDWPVYPRHAEHNTVAKGGNRRWAESPSAESTRAQASVGLKNGQDGIDRWVGGLKALTGPLLGADRRCRSSSGTKKLSSWLKIDAGVDPVPVEIPHVVREQERVIDQQIAGHAHLGREIDAGPQKT